MKKTGILLAVLLVVGIALVAYAAAINISLVRDAANAGASEAVGAKGFVIVNQNPQKTIVEFQVRGLTASKPYWAYYWSGSFHKIGELKMNKHGSAGHLHKNIAPLPSGSYYFGVSDWDPDAPTMTAGNQVLIHATSLPITL